MDGMPIVSATLLFAFSRERPSSTSAERMEVRGVTTEEFASASYEPANGSIVDESIPPETLILPSSWSTNPFLLESTKANSWLVKAIVKAPLWSVFTSAVKSWIPSSLTSKMTLEPTR